MLHKNWFAFRNLNLCIVKRSIKITVHLFHRKIIIRSDITKAAFKGIKIKGKSRSYRTLMKRLIRQTDSFVEQLITDFLFENIAVQRKTKETCEYLQSTVSVWIPMSTLSLCPLNEKKKRIKEERGRKSARTREKVKGRKKGGRAKGQLHQLERAIVVIPLSRGQILCDPPFFQSTTPSQPSSPPASSHFLTE